MATPQTAQYCKGSTRQNTTICLHGQGEDPVVGAGRKRRVQCAIRIDASDVGSWFKIHGGEVPARYNLAIRLSDQRIHSAIDRAIEPSVQRAVGVKPRDAATRSPTS